MPSVNYRIDVTSGQAFYDYPPTVFESKCIPLNLVIDFTHTEEILAPIIITRVDCDDKVLEFKAPITIKVAKEYFDNELAYTAVNKDFYIDIYDDSIENLKLAVEENICFLWETYALEDDNKLTLRAQKIKKAYLENIIG